MISNIKNLIKIQKSEVLRYLQYNNQDISEELNLKIHSCINSTKNIFNPRYIYKICTIDKQKMKDNEGVVYLRDENIKFESKDIHNLLNGCNECMLILATLGLEIEREIRKLTYIDLARCVIVDACATVAIEEVCDIIQDTLEEDLLRQGKYITRRYSPGYGDLSIEKNKDINNILNGQNRIGLTVNDSGIMIPRKSVVAIIGISNNSINKTNKSCENCSSSKYCKFKKGANNCGR